VNLFIQIPCHNEEGTLPAVVADLPVAIEGVDAIYTLVIDDGSSDRTVEVAREIGVDYILVNPRRLGLARSFGLGLETCLSLGADIIVNTDGDHQYRGEDIPRLVRAALEDRADLVVGCRDIDNHREFSPLKKILQKWGSTVVRAFSRTTVADTTSGFRAITREAALRLQIMNSFSYTVEMLIQAGRSGLHVAGVPIGVNPATRESRLFRSTWHFVLNQIKVLFSIYLFYCPMRFFGWLAAGAFAVALLSGTRVAYYLWFVEDALQKYKAGTGALMTVTLILGVTFLLCGVFGSLFSGLRLMLEDVRYRVRSVSLARDGIRQGKLIESPTPFRWQSR
jgi:glycosyltransferase involved in cell wall biosynthesis